MDQKSAEYFDESGASEFVAESGRQAGKLDQKALAAKALAPQPQLVHIITFAAQNVACAASLNAQLERLRYRLFEDEISGNEISGNDAKEGPGNQPEPLETPLVRQCARTHFDLARALDQLDAIHNRL